MLGCAVAGMGISLLPRIVLTTFPDAKLLSVHPLPRGLDRTPTVLIWRKGALSPKVRALMEILLERSNIALKPQGRRANGRGVRAVAAGSARS